MLQEQDLKDRLDRIVDGLDVPAERIEAAARIEGRRRRVRRRASNVIGIAACAAALATVTPTVFGGSSTAPGFAGLPDDGSQTVLLGEISPPGWWNQMTAREMFRHLESMLPEGAEATEVEFLNFDTPPEDADEPHRGRLLFNLDTGSGPGAAELMFYGPRTSPPDRDVEPALYWALRCRPAWLDCELRRDQDGEVVAKLMTDVYQGVTINTVYARGADGAVIRAASANSVADKWEVPTSAPVPPLTVEQLLEIAQSEAWSG
ncbi:MAG TPA: hypothetical protein VLI04_15465 [Nocardioidaceae bacterium]|nr:hypothetical protein [Nocardioidaceae bacterium]